MRFLEALIRVSPRARAALEGKPPLKPRQRAADLLVRKMHAEQQRYSSIVRRWPSGACCPDCWSGGKTSRIREAQERRRTMLEVQLKRDALPCHLEFLRLAQEENLDLAEPLARFVVDP
jgi:hypothetical protein